MTQFPIKSKLIEAILAWNPLNDPLEWPDEVFNRWAKKLFRFQFEQNEPYRKYCLKRQISPETVEAYRDVPAVPTDVFKYVELTTASDPTRIFRTSGTTLGRQGEHRFGTLDVYKAALVAPFRRFCAFDHNIYRMLAVAPSGQHMPESSLSFMIDALMAEFGDEQSDYFVRQKQNGELRLEFDRLRAALDQAQADDAVVILLGTSFGFVEFFDFCKQNWQLKAGSRIMETGGFKGKSREVSADELRQLFETRLGISPDYVVSEYSMTELSSQAYSDNLTHLRSADFGPKHDLRHRAKTLQTPPWVRVELVDPLDFEPIETSGQQGLIRWYDLANTESVLAVQTSDLGVLAPDGGFELLGRAPQAELRGCSLTIEEIVDASR